MFEKINTELALYYKRAIAKAEKLAIMGRDRIEPLLDIAVEKAQKNKAQMEELWADFKTLTRMIRSWVNGGYTDVPWKSIVLAIAAIIYVVNPLDLVPDFLGALGFLDDITVIGFVLKSLREDVKNYLKWENIYKEIDSHKEGEDHPSDDQENNHTD